MYTSMNMKQIVDDRGSVLHFFRCDDIEYTNFGECYFSEAFPGSVKAWKRHRQQTQNLIVPVGRLRLVIFDDRIDSVTRGKIEVLELGRPERYQRIGIPPGLWYGFTALGTSPALVVNLVDYPHDPLECERLPEDDRHIPYRWSKQ